MPIPADALAVMVKAPVPGQVKTRLLPALSAEEAAQFYQALLLDQLNHLSRLEGAALYVAFAPEDARSTIAALAPGAFRLFPQEGVDLSTRMQQVFERLCAWGHRNMILIGSDLAPVPFATFKEGFAALEAGRGRVVLGPSRDGGYYLVGMNRLTPEMFTGISWGHDQVLAQTLTRLAELKVDKVILPAWFDIDTPQDLHRLQRDLPPELNGTLTHTVEFLRRLESNQKSSPGKD